LVAQTRYLQFRSLLLKSKVLLGDREIFTPEGGPPQAVPGLQEIYSEWGEEGIRNLVSSFYDRIPLSKIAHMFPEDLSLAKQKQGDFLIQVTGGPPNYSQKWGPPKMRMRHFPFEINNESREEWLRCYLLSLNEFEFSSDSKKIFYLFLEQFSLWMVNKR